MQNLTTLITAALVATFAVPAFANETQISVSESEKLFRWEHCADTLERVAERTGKLAWDQLMAMPKGLDHEDGRAWLEEKGVSPKCIRLVVIPGEDNDDQEFLTVAASTAEDLVYFKHGLQAWTDVPADMKQRFLTIGPSPTEMYMIVNDDTPVQDIESK